MTTARNLRRIADDLKRYANEAQLPGYRERLLRAAQDLEQQAAEHAGRSDDADETLPKVSAD